MIDTPNLFFQLIWRSQIIFWGIRRTKQSEASWKAAEAVSISWALMQVPGTQNSHFFLVGIQARLRAITMAIPNRAWMTIMISK